LEAVVVSALRYESVLTGGQQLGLPRASYSRLYALGVRNEGFASPFNSRLLPLGHSDTVFCSLFPDTDSIFGSIGPFQTTKLSDYTGGWTINPPFIEFVMEETVNHLAESLEKTPLIAFLLLPAWDDATSVQMSKNNKFVVNSEKLNKGKYTMEEPGGRIFISTFDTYYTVFNSALSPNIEMSSRLYDAIHLEVLISRVDHNESIIGGDDSDEPEPNAEPEMEEPEDAEPEPEPEPEEPEPEPEPEDAEPEPEPEPDNTELEEPEQNIINSTPSYTTGQKTYAIISGEVTNEERVAIRMAFNSLDNMHGDIIKVILVSKTGAEGLDLKWIRETHQLEPYWDKSRDHQVIARAVRMGSHDGLPRDERTVQPYVYVSVANSKVYSTIPPKERELKTIDETFFERANKKYATNLAFRQMLSEVCLECELFNYGNCRMCIPTNAPLFNDNPIIDTKVADPCSQLVETSIDASSVEVDGVLYYYVPDPTEVLGYQFYTFDKELGGNIKLDPSDPVIGKLILLLDS
jgi:hypothetical protein